MIVVFDLDDTLYHEISYVKSGFRAVSKFISNQYKQKSEDSIYAKFIEVLETQGRGKVFDVVLKNEQIYSKQLVRKCLTTYRLHNPNIKLHKAGQDCLNRLKDYTKYLVTDGNKVVQTKKIDELDIRKHFKKVMPTHNYGVQHSKPSTYCFEKILKWENVEAKDLIYIADNPNKDFVNLNKNGYKTVRVLTGPFKDLRVKKIYDGQYTIDSLDELTIDFLSKLYRL